MPYYGYYGIDMYYIVLVLPCVLFAFWAQSKVNSTFNRYSQVQNLRGLTGAQAAEAVLRYNGVSGVRIEYVSGKLTDHFDPRSNVIRLSSAVYSSTSVASIGVAAHEAGHAVQYAIGYAPIKLRAAIIPLTQFGSMAAMPLLIDRPPGQTTDVYARSRRTYRCGIPPRPCPPRYATYPECR